MAKVVINKFLGSFSRCFKLFFSVNCISLLINITCIYFDISRMLFIQLKFILYEKNMIITQISVGEYFAHNLLM